MPTALLKSSHRLHGATFVHEVAEFRVWAPQRGSVQVVFVAPDCSDGRKVEMCREADGFFSASIDEAQHGDLYFFQVDNDPRRYPDPASHFQPQGVHGPSQVVDHRRLG
jgi:maltooligosyltrehalose trehalohydrolase